MSSRAVVGDWTRAFTPVEKSRLTAEILRTYVQVRRVMRGHQLVEALAQLRGGVGVTSPLPPGRDMMRTGVRLGNAVRRTLTVLPTDSRCLMRALVLSTLLSRRGIESLLVIAARTEPTFSAHAWVEYQGLPLLPPGDEHMRRLVEL